MITQELLKFIKNYQELSEISAPVSLFTNNSAYFFQYDEIFN